MPGVKINPSYMNKQDVVTLLLFFVFLCLVGLVWVWFLW